MDESGRATLAHELRRSEIYEALLTTGGGLYRHRLGDLVRVDGMVKLTPSVRFIGRAVGASDLLGEELSEALVGTVLDEWNKHFKISQISPCSPGIRPLASPLRVVSPNSAGPGPGVGRIP
jgi:hypothetical protein